MAASTRTKAYTKLTFLFLPRLGAGGRGPSLLETLLPRPPDRGLLDTSGHLDRGRVVGDGESGRRARQHVQEVLPDLILKER